MHWLTVDPSGGVDVSPFAQYGLLGTVAGLLLWFTKGAIQRERDRADRLESEVRRLNDLIADRAIPALTAASRAAEEAAALLNSVQREREARRLMEERHVDRGGD